jgi:hypothetical protein
MEPPLSPSQFIEQMMGMLQRQFYPDNEKEFFQDRDLLMMSITAPAEYLEARAVRVPLKRQSEIFREIIQTIKQNGNTVKIRRFSAYLLHCVQTHLQHHGDEYYDEGKRTRDALEDVMKGWRVVSGKVADPGDSVERLAELNAMVRAARGGRKKGCKRPSKGPQMDLFSAANRY